jgi:hypothetical protein
MLTLPASVSEQTAFAAPLGGIYVVLYRRLDSGAEPAFTRTGEGAVYFQSTGAAEEKALLVHLSTGQELKHSGGSVELHWSRLNEGV